MRSHSQNSASGVGDGAGQSSGGTRSGLAVDTAGVAASSVTVSAPQLYGLSILASQQNSLDLVLSTNSQHRVAASARQYARPFTRRTAGGGDTVARGDQALRSLPQHEHAAGAAAHTSS